MTDLTIKEKGACGYEWCRALGAAGINPAYSPCQSSMRFGDVDEKSKRKIEHSVERLSVCVFN